MDGESDRAYDPGVLEAVLSVMVSMAPHEPVQRLREVATAITEASASVDDAALLVTISFFETRFEHSGVSFGMVSMRRRLEGQPLVEWARACLRMLERARRCSPEPAVFLGWYHTGRCEADDFSRREAARCALVRREIATAIARQRRESPPRRAA